MQGYARRVGRPPKKKWRAACFGDGLSCVHCGLSNVVCGCIGNTAEAVVDGEDSESMLRGVFVAVDVKKAMCVDVDGAGASGSDDGLRVFRESDVEGEDNDSNNDMLDEAFDEDMHAEGIVDGVDGLLQGDNSVGGFVELLQQCRNCC